jgi:ketosteroid isomerase-like protein
MYRLSLISLVLLVAIVSPVVANESSDIEAVKAEIKQFWSGLANGEMATEKFAAEQIVAYSSGGMWEYITAAKMVASLTEGPRLVTKAYHVNVRLVGEAKDVAYASYYLGGKITTKEAGVVVANYRTRISQVLEKKGNKWIFVASHASPLFGGSGYKVD